MKLVKKKVSPKKVIPKDDDYFLEKYGKTFEQMWELREQMMETMTNYLNKEKRN